MLAELEPEVILVYGPMPNVIFSGLTSRAQFIQYPDWMSRMKRDEERIVVPKE